MSVGLTYWSGCQGSDKCCTSSDAGEGGREGLNKCNKVGAASLFIRRLADYWLLWFGSSQLLLLESLLKLISLHRKKRVRF